jgi:hypothetical protein
MRTLITLAAVALLAGCASSGRIDPGYAGYLQAHDRAAERRAGELAAIADATACNGDATCVTAAKASLWPCWGRCRGLGRYTPRSTLAGTACALPR